MRGRPNSHPTTDELIATIRRSGFPNLVIEGGDDVVVLRDVEKFCSDISLELIPAGGRNAVLEIFQRREELVGGPAVLFLVDRDTWIHTGIPAEFDHANVLTTDGYSIENDIFRDGRLERLLAPSELEEFLRDLDAFLDWYVLALSRFLKGIDEPLDLKVNRVLHPITRPALVKLEAGEVFPGEIKAAHLESYSRVLRGKSLFDLFLRRVNQSGRRAKYSRYALLEIGATSEGPLLKKLFEQIAEKTALTAQ